MKKEIEQYLNTKNITMTFEPIYRRTDSNSFYTKDWQGYHFNVNILLNGKVAIKDVQYSVGIGNMQGYLFNKRIPILLDKILKEMLKQGLEFKKPYNMGDFASFNTENVSSIINKTTQPHKLSIVNVMYSLIMDSEVLDYESFEDWADCFGYDTDSKKAEKIYNACIKSALKLNRLFSSAEREELKELFSDY